ncbi:hypothetical protein Enr13x_39590 [Stieleria neptunia]|uniref:Bacteriophage T5 Orf172 DNA-binding domain-containing protein n=1 Tax=Stieleria neptunia TaxID=2527979 RepID=A0A518HTB6_9BACT|nr:GIY-YIG nuclease family protein [Stieleria neptunia]QDV44098.1 hypothetical protein Enr13x_39590 [Stieleria neptunia]
MESDQKQTRYCPECGSKVVSTEDKFQSPQICPNCKTRVLFLNYSREPIPAIQDESGNIKTRDPKIDQKLAIMITGTVLFLLLVGLVAFISGQLTLFFAIGCLMFVGGVVAISVFLDGQSKIAALNEASDELDSRVRFHEQNQTRLVHAHQGLKTNFDALVAVARSNLDAEFEQLLRDAKNDREAAAFEYETASEHASAASAISKRLFTEVRRSIKSRLTPNNYATQKDRFLKTVAFCEKKGYPIDQATIDEFEVELKKDYEEAVRAQFAKEEQARIKEKIREEQKAERELEREMKRLDAERRAIEKAIAAALERTHDEHSTEVEELRRRLAEAEAKSARAMSMAQQTRAGNVYVISNYGSFGEGVFKIGLTRRLEPLDRVKELGDASVPFPFDVHMMISSDDAPSLEAALHREFKSNRVNRINLRKEFFRVPIDEIAEAVERCRAKVDYIAEPEALEYNESLRMTDDDFEFVSSQVDPETLAED